MTEEYIDIPPFLRRESEFRMPKINKSRRYCENGPWKGKWIYLPTYSEKTMTIKIGNEIGYYSKQPPNNFIKPRWMASVSGYCFWHPVSSALS